MIDCKTEDYDKSVSLLSIMARTSEERFRESTRTLILKWCAGVCWSTQTTMHRCIEWPYNLERSSKTAIQGHTCKINHVSSHCCHLTQRCPSNRFKILWYSQGSRALPTSEKENSDIQPLQRYSGPSTTPHMPLSFNLLYFPASFTLAFTFPNPTSQSALTILKSAISTPPALFSLFNAATAAA